MRIHKACLLICILTAALSGCGKKEPETEAQVPAAVITAVPKEAPQISPTPVPTPVPAPAGTPVEVSLSVQTPTPTPSPVPTPSPTPVPFLGEWTYRFEEKNIRLSLKNDGSGTILYNEKEQPFTWEYADGKILLAGVNTTFSAVFSDNTLSVTTLDGTLVFTGKELA